MSSEINFPKSWEERKNSYLCPVCSKEKKYFEKGRRVYCCKAHADKVWDYIKSWGSVRAKIIDRDKKCVLCGCGESLEVDHIKAITNGGKMWDESNLRVLCHSCHVKKTRVDLLIMKTGCVQTTFGGV